MLQFKSDSNSLELEKTLRLGARFPKRLPHLRHQPPVGPHFCPLTTDLGVTSPSGQMIC